MHRSSDTPSTGMGDCYCRLQQANWKRQKNYTSGNEDTWRCNLVSDIDDVVTTTIRRWIAVEWESNSIESRSNRLLAITTLSLTYLRYISLDYLEMISFKLTCFHRVVLESLRWRHLASEKSMEQKTPLTGLMSVSLN